MSGGVGVQKSEEEAFKWFKVSANQGYPDAQNEIGYRYSQGKGVEKSKDKAIHYLRLAHEIQEEAA